MAELENSIVFGITCYANTGWRFEFEKISYQSVITVIFGNIGFLLVIYT